MYAAANQAQRRGPSWSQVQGMHMAAMAAMAARRGVCNLGGAGEVNERDVKPCRLPAHSLSGTNKYWT